MKSRTVELQARWDIEQAHARAMMSDVECGVADDGVVRIVGTYHLKSAHGYLHDSFRLRIEYPSAYPRPGVLPNVFLESHRGKWRNGRDSHIESSWKLCLFVPAEAGIRAEDDRSLLKLFAAVHTFLIRQRIYQRTIDDEVKTGRPPVWPGADRSHGDTGLREAARETKSGRNSRCVCGSGKKYKHCCKRRLGS